MKNKLALIALVVMLIPVVGTAMAADNKNYLGLQYGVGEYSESGISEDFDTSMAILRVGYNINSNFAIEGRLGTGLDDDTQFLAEFSGTDVTFEVDSIVGIYGRGRLDLSERFSVYGVLGASQVKATVSLSGLPDAENTETESSASYGLGVDMAFSKQWALNVEVIRYLDHDNYDLDIASAGVTYGF